jgi:hypothetical protein
MEMLSTTRKLQLSRLEFTIKGVIKSYLNILFQVFMREVLCVCYSYQIHYFYYLSLTQSLVSSFRILF